MGTGIVNFWNNKVSKEQKIAFVSAFLITLFVHLYKFTNTLLNHDAMYNVYTKQNMVGSGRWALQAACGISSYYDLPWVIGVLCCLFIALTVMVIVALLRIKNPILIFLTGGILATSPAVTETFFFLFTADGYMIAMFLAALAVYLSRLGEKRLVCYLLSGLCLCVSCGIYQAYISFALILAVCHFLYELLENRWSIRDYLLWILRQVLIFALSLAAYYILWKLILQYTGRSANTYQGISEVGTITPDLLRHGLVSAWNSVLYYFFQLTTWGYAWSPYSAINAVSLAALAVGLVLAVVKSEIYRRPWALVLVILCVLAVIPFAGMWCFTSYTVSYRPLMLQSLMLLFVFAGLLCERWAGNLTKNLIGLLLAVMVIHNGVLANISYFYMNLCYERTYADGIEMVMEIHDIQDETPFENIAVLGNRYARMQWPVTNSDGTALSREGNIYILSSLLEQNLLVDSHQIRTFLSWYLGTGLKAAPNDVTTALSQDPHVQAMPVWPAEGSMQVIDDTLVLKISGLTN